MKLCQYHLDSFIPQGRTDNFSHPAVIALCKRFYYAAKHDSLSSLFDEFSNKLPPRCLALVLTCVRVPFDWHPPQILHDMQLVHCLHEFRSGNHISSHFTGQDYSSMYEGFVEMIEETMDDPYHGQKLKRLLKQIAKEGM